MTLLNDFITDLLFTDIKFLLVVILIVYDCLDKVYIIKFNQIQTYHVGILARHQNVIVKCKKCKYIQPFTTVIPLSCY